ncbi:MAG: ABC transporter permease subunit [Lentisphaerae bacterium]|nr:ABC transporter permease subunit [Lentisphaerota bacterium]MCP4101338.1 ABC transporter permease subunit [Lentisphaerota bacterium]
MNQIKDFYNNLGSEILRLSIQHLELTLIAMVIAILIAVPLGIIIAKTKTRIIQSATLSSISMVQTIPSLALIAFVMIIFKAAGLHTIGFFPGITALVVYALLPIVRNTYTGISQVEPSTIEVAKSMGMTKTQILFRVELPLSIPVIMAGIKISTTWTIGLATLVSLIGAGGLGDLIFSGIRNVRESYIIAGAVPAAVMALIAEWLLGKIELSLTPDGIQDEALHSNKKPRFLTPQRKLVLVGIGFAVLVAFLTFRMLPSSHKKGIVPGFEAEFIARPDGLPGLYKKYNFKFNKKPKHLDTGLMYKACETGSIDVIDGFSTDGRIPAFGLVALKDDKKFFPPYYATPLVRENTLKKFPELRSVIASLAGKISETDMQKMNYSVSREKDPIDPKQAAKRFLIEKGLISVDSEPGDGSAGIVAVGCKDYTEQSIIGQMLSILIEYNTDLKVDRKLNLGGTMICFNALTNGDLDLYVDYTGTVLMSILKKPPVSSPEKAFNISHSNLKEKYRILMTEPLGFNNTYTLTVRKGFSKKYNVKTISDLVKLVQKKKN